MKRARLPPTSAAAVLLAALWVAGCAGEARQPAQRPEGQGKSTAVPDPFGQETGPKTPTPPDAPDPVAVPPDPPLVPPVPPVPAVSVKALPGEETPPTRTPRIPVPAIEEKPAPAAAPSESRPGERFARVTVFYGTDRAAIEPARAHAADVVRWRYAMLVSATATILAASLAIVRPKGRTARLLAGAGLAVTVLLGGATIRARAQARPGDPDPSRFYGNARGELAFGTCEVSIPERHETGELEAPSVFRLEFAKDPAKHVVLLSVEPKARDEFFEQCRRRVGESARREAFVFVHGFNVTFEDAARRTAQLAYDLDFDGPALFFSWPSQGGILRYAADEANAAWTVPHLKEFLVALAEESGAESVHLIAHSMGNRALASALCTLSAECGVRGPMFRQVVLTAPDIDAEVFRRDIAPAIVPTAGRVTLYASAKDQALAASRKYHGYPRAGDAEAGLVVAPGIDTIDVSGVDTSLLGHSYYGSNLAVLADLASLLHEARPPHERPWLRARNDGPLRWWELMRGEVGLGTRSPRTR